MDQKFMGLNTQALAFAGLLAGAIIGVLSGIPLVNCVNCLLLAWVWGGGILAVRLYRGRAGTPFLDATQGLVIGAFAGAVGGLVDGVMTLIFSGLSASVSAMLSQMAGDASQNIPSFLLSGGFTVIGTIGKIVLYAVIGAIGGLIATAVIWKAPAAVPPPPPYNPPQQ